MDVADAIRKRRSVRAYEDRSMPRDVLMELIEAARLAPSSNNSQAWTMVVVQDQRTKEKLVAVSGNQGFVAECSAYIVGTIPKGSFFTTNDLSIALDHLSLRAVELGLGTCWIGDFEPEGLSRILGIPSTREVAMCMTVGYPAEKPQSSPRKQRGELFHSDRWDNQIQ